MAPNLRRETEFYIFEVWSDSCRISVKTENGNPNDYVLLAAPESSSEYKEKAKELGYTDTYLACIEHEAMHVYLSKITGNRSYVIDHESGYVETSLDSRLAEESIVLKCQQVINQVEKSDQAKAFRTWLYYGE